MKKNFLIRVDSSLKIGSGHLMRCLTLAKELRNQNHTVYFACRKLEGNLIILIQEENFPIVELKSIKQEISDFEQNDLFHGHWLECNYKDDFLELLGKIQTLNIAFDWLIVDHYALDHRWEKIMKKTISKIMVIDDLADREHNCDILLDQNFYKKMGERYCQLVPENCKLFLGSQYVLLREEFKIAKKNLARKINEVNNILIFFGGIDLKNETQKAIEAILLLNKPKLQINIVLGKSNPHYESLQNLITQHGNFNLFSQVNNMAELMSKADLFIGAGGSTTWERACLGLPSLITSIAKNQEEIISTLADCNIVAFYHNTISVNELSQKIYSLMNDEEKRKMLSENSLKISDNEISYLLRFVVEFP